MEQNNTLITEAADFYQLTFGENKEIFIIVFMVYITVILDSMTAFINK